MPILNAPSAPARVALAAALAAAALALPACRGDRSEKPPRQFFPDMDEQPRWNPQEGTEFFADGRIMRVPDPRAVAYGPTDHDPAMLERTAWGMPYIAQRERSIGEDNAFYRGLGPDGLPLAVAPLQPTEALIARGQERFNIYCSACHGYLGDGKGTVGQRWSYPPANISIAPYTDRNEEKGRDGHLFHVIRNGVWNTEGVNLMPAYGHALDEADAWAVVFYMRALQRAQNASLGDLPEGDRQRLQSTRGQAPAPDASAPADPDQGGA